MKTISQIDFGNRMTECLELAASSGETFNVLTKHGSVIMMSEGDYNSLMETVYISSVPEVKKDIIEGLNTSVPERIPYDETVWSK